jgi:outer membrane protein insertion porin family
MFKFLFLITFFLFSFFRVSAEIIKDVIIKNNDRISFETIKMFSNVKIGNDYSENDLNKILKDLYKTNFFSDVRLDLENNILTVYVVENKIIQSVVIKGIKVKKLEKILYEKIKLKDKSPYNEYDALQDKQFLKNILSSQGFYFSKIKSFIEENPTNNTIDLIYEINLGEKALISKIEFTGNKIVKDSRLRTIITSEENKFWKFLSSKKYLNTQQVSRDKRLLKNFYLDRGYYNVVITNSTAQYFDAGKFNLVFNIDAGQLFKIKQSKLILPVDYDENNFSKIKEILTNLENTNYSFTKLSKIIDQIDKITLNREYEFITATINEEIVGDDSLNLTIEITESEKKYVQKINILGNNVTQENVIRNQLEVDEGDSFNELLHAKSINKLKSLRIFAKVESKIEEGTDPSKNIINITVEEKPTGEITLGAGVGTDGATLGFAVSENNYLGKGLKVTTSLQLSGDSVRGNFSVFNPNYNYSDRALKMNVESTSTDKLTKNGYKTSKTGFSFGTGYEQYEDLFFSPNISTFYEELSTNSTASSALKKQEGSYFETSFDYNLNYDKRNRGFRPTDGFKSNFIQSVPLVSESYSVLNGFEFNKYNKFGQDWITNLGIYTRAITALASGEDVRVSNRVSLPRNKLKGFESTKTGPLDGTNYVGGNYAASLNFTSSLPMIFPSLEQADFAFFIDAGNVWGVDYSSAVDQSSTIRSSTGLAVNWFTPIGPLNFTLAQALSKAESDQTQSFQFNLGTTF